MKKMVNAFYAKPLIGCLIATLIACSTFAGTAQAMFLNSAPDRNPEMTTASGRNGDILKIQTALESKIIRQRLLDYGLSSDLVMARINALTDAQVHQLALNTDSLQAGGDAVGLIAGAIVVGLLVVLLVFLAQGKIQIK